MIVFPAIDMKDGHVVRLRQGVMDDSTVYSEDPVAVARYFQSQGASHLHVVDLDGAAAGAMVNGSVLESLVKETGLKVQVGGGIRTMERIEALLGLGVNRVILGTAAVQDPLMVERAVARFGCDRVVVGIDAKNGRVAVDGWVTTSDLSIEDLGFDMRDLGVTRIIYTDIHRDGMLTGADIEGAAKLADRTELKVIVSGGIASLDELKLIRRRAVQGVGFEGVIVGKALYSKAFTLREALDAAAIVV
ncbi:MAG: 1-(5-phosphoribosyl)-5-[(5-phosphoribosylamino)methylideneamino]imidazole-4-carboxamide isomerase [Peptococcaceae bacterium]|nr:1-(5-phosphoribosyl)-5-[(5-phosphoribosylamino)methylideneamino]imidazole-4-carboxamide isomerase [Peptococcaceae bacterium]